MASSLAFSLLLCVTMFMQLISPSHSLTCSSQKFTNNKFFDQCNDLPQLNSFLHWAYDSANASLSIAFLAQPASPEGWVAWAINPTGTGMIGSQSLIAFKLPNGTMNVKTYDIKSYREIVESKLSFQVSQMSAEYSGGFMKIYASIALPEKGKTTLNQVWQVGASVTGGFPDKHGFQPGNLASKGTLDLLKAQTGGGSGVDSRLKKKNIHGILNAVSWGILFPTGVIIARYLRTFPSADPAWFYLHAFCQTSSYAIGVAGWGTGLKLGSQSKGIQYTGHRNIGIALFALATLQIFALFLRPKKDHKYRFYWNIYHHGIGYSIVILGIINVFKGLDILDPGKTWKSTYIGVIIALGVVALLLEAITWIVVLRRKSGNSTKTQDGFNNGQSRQQPLAN